MKRRTKEVELRLTLFVFFNFLYAKKLSFEKEWRCSTNAGKNSVKFTDKVPFLTDLSVSKTHFTDKPAISSDLSVNFWPLWWGFTDKAGFSKHLSVKTGPKRLNFYGQTSIFDHFVRNCHFLSSPFTDKTSIFSYVSVNGSYFVKCSVR